MKCGINAVRNGSPAWFDTTPGMPDSPVVVTGELQYVLLHFFDGGFDVEDLG
jgi:hypothetical protein